MGAASPFSEAERRSLREVAKDVIGGRISPWNEGAATHWGPMIKVTVTCLGRESAELCALPYEGGFLEQPTRTMQAIGVIQEAFAEKLRSEYEKMRKRRG